MLTLDSEDALPLESAAVLTAKRDGLEEERTRLAWFVFVFGFGREKSLCGWAALSFGVWKWWFALTVTDKQP